MVSFKEGSLLLSELAGVKVNAKQVERTSEALGREIAEDERTYSRYAVLSDALSRDRRHGHPSCGRAS
jgi:hypothetical protein